VSSETRLALVLLGIAVAVPFAHGLDRMVASGLEAVRTCAGQRVFSAISNWTRPVGFGLTIALLLRHLLAGRPARLRSAFEVLTALAAGALLIEGMKRVIERPRPGAAVLSGVGNAYPSGHTGNVLLCAFAILCLARGGTGRRLSRGEWTLVAAVTLLVGTSRVYIEHHWASDVAGSTALMGAFGLLAFLNPSARTRTAAILGTAALSGLLLVGGAHGWRVHVAGGIPVTAPPLLRFDFATAAAAGSLRGAWSADRADPAGRGTWLIAPGAQLVLGPLAGRADEVRVVVRPHSRPGMRACRRLRVELNGMPLGERLLHAGWRAYVFPVRGRFSATDANVFTFAVSSGGAGHDPPRPPLVGFRELTVHGDGQGG
jgi:undecaprenyl-diphosphatase